MQIVFFMVKYFEELESWQMARDLSLLVYRRFKNCRDFRFRDQIQSAAVSVMNNIAEGFERKKGTKEFAMFLYISKGSAGEVRSMLSLAVQLGYLNQEEYKELRELCMRMSAMVYMFIRSL